MTSQSLVHRNTSYGPEMYLTFLMRLVNYAHFVIIIVWFLSTTHMSHYLKSIPFYICSLNPLCMYTYVNQVYFNYRILYMNTPTTITKLPIPFRVLLAL